MVEFICPVQLPSKRYKGNHIIMYRNHPHLHICKFNPTLVASGLHGLAPPTEPGSFLKQTTNLCKSQRNLNHSN